MLVFGAVLMSMMIFMRRGLVPSIAQAIRRAGS
jgi:ABC-type branched-subunit amino acid transport system permease subunit